MNQVTFVGRLCRQVELKELADSLAVTNNVIAVTRPFKDRNGESVTDFIPFTAWNGIAKTLHKYACKGQRVAIAGTMQSRNYKNDQDQEIYVIECNVSELTLLDKPRSKEKELQTKVEDLEVIDKEDVQVAKEMVEEVITHLDQSK